MGSITVDTKYGAIDFNLSGDQPNLQEKIKINKVLQNLETYVPQEKIDSFKTSQGGDDPSFDTKTGVKDTKLRSALSFADTGTEEEAVLQKFGLQEGQYLRDNRGRLALSPEGAQVFGIDTDKNILVDESGFSMSDFTDLSGLVPEIGGAVAGAIAGQAAIPIPILGAMIGAAIGGGGGNLLEEAGEGIAGTSRQTAGEIAKQTATEAAIAAAGEGIFGVIGKAFKTFAKGPAGKGVSDEQRKLIKESRELGKDLLNNEKLGIDPSANLMGAPALVARQQALSEKIFKTSPRLKKNNDTINAVLDDLKQKANITGDDTSQALGRALNQAAQTGETSLIQAERTASRKLLEHMQAVSDDIGRAAEVDEALDDDLMMSFVDAFRNFDEQSAAKFAQVDAALESAIGNSKIFNVVSMKANAKEQLEKLLGTAPTKEFNLLDSTLKGINQLGDDATYSQLYNVRKSLRDLRFENAGSKTLVDNIDSLVVQLDAITSPQAVEALSPNIFKGSGTGSKEIIRKAVNSVDEARGFYRQGMEKFEELQKAGIYKDIAAKVRTGRDLDASGTYLSLIKNNNPKPLKSLYKVLDKSSKTSADEFKEKMAGQWLRQTLKDSLDPTDPSKFRGSILKSKLDSLGSTADELFGSKVGQVKALSEQLNKLSLKNVSKADIDEFIKLKPNANSVNLLKDLLQKQTDLADLKRSSTMKKLGTGDLTDIQASELVVSKNTTSADLKRLMKYFEGDQKSLNNIRSNFMEDVIGDFGDNFLLEPKQFTAFSKRIDEAYSSGKLETIYGTETAERMAKFARVLKFNAKTAEGGDLIAANIAASPLQNLGKLAKYSILGRLFSSEVFYKNFENELVKKGVTFGSALRTTLSQFIAQETQGGIQETNKQAKAIFESSTKPNKSSVPMQMPNVTPPAPGSSLSNVSVVTPQSKPYKAIPVPSDAAINNYNSIRQRAAQNPAVATSLLGGLGNMDLLNR